MFAVVQIGSQQFKVTKGDVIEAHKIDQEVNDSLTIDQVLLLSDGTNIQIGRPYLDSVKVEVKVVDHHQGDKVIAYKYRRRLDSSSKVGHRAQLTGLKIVDIK